MKKIILTIGIIFLLIDIAIVPTNAILDSSVEEGLIIYGPANGFVGVSYDFQFFLSSNPYGDSYYIQISWRIDNITDWMGPYPTGQNITISNTWDKIGIYIIQAFADCNKTFYYATYQVGISKNKVLETFDLEDKLINNIFFRILHRFPLLNLIFQGIY